MLSFFLCNLPGMWYTAVMTERRDPMRAEERRQAIRELLQRAKQPVSATALAAQFSVSRQIIVVTRFYMRFNSCTYGRRRSD